ncbi:hypothetical protein ACFVAF_17175 [Streptomyces sp. NPDC057596]|uniref:hypothetical protein n=1 Tax=Streptomyces sp. NPDC057596 TaxID=3346178 RepID=UPI0036A16D38
MQPARSRGRLMAVGATAMLLVTSLVTSAHANPDPGKGKDPKPSTPVSQVAPALTPADGEYLEGRRKVAAEPVAAGDSVTELSVDDKRIDATRTLGVSELRFDVGSNSTEARYHNHVLVNGSYRAEIGDFVNERATLEVPNEYLVTGENTVEIHAGAIETSCGMNHDDFVLSDVSLDLLGEVADG